MRLAPGAWAVAATFGLGLAGLVLPGPAGDVTGFIWLGVFPGLALTRLFLPGAATATRWTLGVALAPLATTVVGWALLQSGQSLQSAARLVAMGGWVLFAGGEARSLVSAGRSEEDAPGDRQVWGWAIAAVAVVAIPLLGSEWLRVRGDSWLHAGSVWEIAERGLPPQDPRFAGFPIGDAWFYDLFIALAGAVRSEPTPFATMATANACWMGAQVWLGWQLAWTLWRDRGTACAVPPLLLAGLNAGALLLWPLRALGARAGDAAPEGLLAAARWDRVDAVQNLSAPFAWPVSSWDLFTLGTPRGYACLLMLVLLWAGSRWLTDTRERGSSGAPPAWRWLFVVVAAAAGIAFFHRVFGLAAIAVSAAASGLLALIAGGRTGWGETRRALVLGGALLVGLVLAWTGFRTIFAGGELDRIGRSTPSLSLGWRMPWTLLTACGLAALVALPGLRRVFDERRLAGLWLAACATGMLCLALVVQLPGSSPGLFVWALFAPLAVLGGAGAPEWFAGARRRLGPVLGVGLLGACFVLPTVLFLFGYLSDPSGATAAETHRAPGDSALYTWVRSETPARAVFLDHRSRDVLLVEGRRRLLAGAPHDSERPALPRDLLSRRRAVMADLYGPVADLAGDVAHLDSLGAPVYVLYRMSDFPHRSPWAALDADTLRFERVYLADRSRVYRLQP